MIVIRSRKKGETPGLIYTFKQNNIFRMIVGVCLYRIRVSCFIFVVKPLSFSSTVCYDAIQPSVSVGLFANVL